MRTRYVQVGGVLHEVGKDYVQVRNAESAHNIIGDIDPYQSMVTGETIGGRRQHREHLRQHGMVEIGNEHDKLKQFESKPSVNWREALSEQLGRRGML